MPILYVELHTVLHMLLYSVAHTPEGTHEHSHLPPDPALPLPAPACSNVLNCKRQLAGDTTRMLCTNQAGCTAW